MSRESKIKGLVSLGNFLNLFLNKRNENEENYIYLEKEFHSLLIRSEIENPWFTQENLFFSLKSWVEILNEESIKRWLEKYNFSYESKNVGIILAGNLPLVGFHDILCTVLSGNMPIIKLSSKDKIIIPFLMKIWNELSENSVNYEFVEKLENFDAIIATGSDNTAKYMEYYFRKYPRIIRKNRTSLAVLTGNENNKELQGLAEDIFRYFGMGCRNVTKIFIPENFDIEKLFMNFVNFSDIINHHKYANNYEYNKALYLLNKEKFWDNGFVMLRECEDLFSPLSVVNFSRYKSLESVIDLVQNAKFGIDVVQFGESQKPSIYTYADNVDTMEFLGKI